MITHEEFSVRRAAREAKRAYMGRTGASCSLAHEWVHEVHDLAERVREVMSEAQRRRDEVTALIADAAARAEPTEDDLACADEFPVASAETRAVAETFAKRVANAMIYLPHGVVPRFAAGHGMDLYWATEKARLNVAIPAEGRGNIEFFADTRQGETISGTIVVDGNIDFLARWFSARA